MGRRDRTAVRTPRFKVASFPEPEASARVLSVLSHAAERMRHYDGIHHSDTET